MDECWAIKAAGRPTHKELIETARTKAASVCMGFHVHAHEKVHGWGKSQPERQGEAREAFIYAYTYDRQTFVHMHTRDIERSTRAHTHTHIYVNITDERELSCLYVCMYVSMHACTHRYARHVHRVCACVRDVQSTNHPPTHLRTEHSCQRRGAMENLACFVSSLLFPPIHPPSRPPI